MSFLLFFHPDRQNGRANTWLALFVFIMACAFLNVYISMTQPVLSNVGLLRWLNSLQYLLAPSLYISVLYFVTPAKKFLKKDWLHFMLFAGYVCAENIWQFGATSISTVSLFAINENVSFLVRDLLPFLTLFYLIKCYAALARHRSNLKLIASSVEKANLEWLVQFLYILFFTIVIWINDALLELPYLTASTPSVYGAVIFFMAYFSITGRNFSF